MENNCHIPDLVQEYPCVENGGLNLVLQLAKPLICMAVPRRRETDNIKVKRRIDKQNSTQKTKN